MFFGLIKKAKATPNPAGFIAIGEGKYRLAVIPSATIPNVGDRLEITSEMILSDRYEARVYEHQVIQLMEGGPEIETQYGILPHFPKVKILGHIGLVK